MSGALSAGTVSIGVHANTKGFGAELQGLIRGESGSLGTLGTHLGGVLAKGIGAGIAVAGVASLKLAADFQEATTQLVTGAGESEKSIGMVREGLLKMAPAVGMGPQALAKAMFLVESAGFHAADGLLVMKAAAEGARIGGADATVVANGLTTALTDYHLPAKQAATITSQLAATVAAGKTNMSGLAGSLSAVLPSAAAAKIGLSQVLGAMATMTGQGISADQASQNLANTIRSLQNPSQVASKTMAAMGLNSTTVAQQLGTKGLTGTLSELTTAITKHMGPAGLVLQSAFNTSKLAAQSANEELKNLPKSLQGLAQKYLDGTITQKEWTKALKNQPALTASLGKQFATTAKEAHGFNDSLKSGSGPGKTYSAILSDMLGGATGLNTGLALTGGNMATFTTNTKNISSAVTEAGGHVKGWAKTQEDFNVQVAQAKAKVEALGVEVGTKMIPVITKSVDWFSKHTTAATVLAVAIGAVATAAIAMKVASVISSVAQGVATAAMTAWKLITTESLRETLALKAMYLGSAIASGVMTAAQWLLNTSLYGFPLTWIIGGIVLLIAAIVAIATKTTWFQTIWEYMSGALGKAWQYLWNTILAPIIRFVLDGIGSMIGGISNMLLALGHVPGFGWATDAGNAMKGAAAQAHALANGITDIPDKKNIDIRFTSNYSQLQQQLLSVSNSAVKLAANGHLAGGTDNWRGGPTWVGEEGPEILDLPAGSKVTPHADSMKRAGGGDTHNWYVTGPTPEALYMQFSRRTAALGAV